MRWKEDRFSVKGKRLIDYGGGGGRGGGGGGKRELSQQVIRGTGRIIDAASRH